MERRNIGLIVLGVCACVVMLRNGLFARRGSNVCSRATNKFECSAEQSMIQEEQERCMESCPSKDEWVAYCEETQESCDEECDYLLDEGKPEVEVERCKSGCKIREEECKKGYKTKGQCSQDCQKSFDANLKAFEGRWSK